MRSGAQTLQLDQPPQCTGGAHIGLSGLADREMRHFSPSLADAGLTWCNSTPTADFQHLQPHMPARGIFGEFTAICVETQQSLPPTAGAGLRRWGMALAVTGHHLQPTIVAQGTGGEYARTTAAAGVENMLPTAEVHFSTPRYQERVHPCA